MRVLKAFLGIGALRNPSVASWSAGTLRVRELYGSRDTRSLAHRVAHLIVTAPIRGGFC
jgi:hypothetical protein